MPGSSEQTEAKKSVPQKNITATEASRKINEVGVIALVGIWQEITQQPYWQEFIGSRQQPLRITMIGTGQRIEEIIALQRTLGRAHIYIIDNDPESLAVTQEIWHEFQLGHPETADMHVQFETVDLASVDEQSEKSDLLVAHNMAPGLFSILFEGKVPRLVAEGGLVATTFARPMDVGLVDLRYAWKDRPNLKHWMPQMERVDSRQFHGYEPEDTHPLVRAFGAAWSDATLRVFKVTPPGIRNN